MAAKKKDKFKNEPPLPGFEHKQAVNEMYKEYKQMDLALQDMISTFPARPDVESEFELCQEIAVALKQELRESGKSREDFCDEVNLFLGRSEGNYKQDPPLCRKPLAKPTLDKMISDPVNYSIDCYYLFAFQHVLKGFGVINTIVSAKDARVMSGEDRKLITLARLRELKEKVQRLEKNLS